MIARTVRWIRKEDAVSGDAVEIPPGRWMIVSAVQASTKVGVVLEIRDQNLEEPRRVKFVQNGIDVEGELGFFFGTILIDETPYHLVEIPATPRAESAEDGPPRAGDE